MGEGQTVLDERFYARNVFRVTLDLHAWTRGAPMGPAKALAGAIAAALAGPALALETGRCIDFRVASTRFLRDPSNEWGHAVVTVEALVDTLSTGSNVVYGQPSAAPVPAPVPQVEFDFTAQSVWVIKHNLNRRPVIIATDTAGTEIEGDLSYVDANTAEISFAVPVTGKAFLS